MGMIYRRKKKRSEGLRITVDQPAASLPITVVGKLHVAGKRTWPSRGSKIVEAATVSLTKKGGRGVLVGGGLILTAAHCVEYRTEGAMALGDHFLEPFTSAGGEKLIVCPVIVEPVSDIAVLGPLDGQTFYEDCERFEEFSEHTKPVPLCLDEFELLSPFPVYIYGCDGWTRSTAQLCRRDANLIAFEFGTQFKPGTSGSPVTNESGQLVGIVSHDGAAPRPHLALPVWICQRILGKVAEKNEKGE